MYSLRNIAIESDPPFLNSAEFQDSTEFREWLLRDRDVSKEDTSENVVSYKLVYAITQEMSQLRYRTEEFYKQHDYVALNKRKELPVSIEEILDKITSADRDKEPPETVISRIAQYDISVIELTLANVRKILRRERKMTGIASVQQLDSQCLIWLTKQPGITPAQKAGIRQKIMAVVRKESYNTLENRVLKAFLQLCASFCTRYLKEYKIRFPNSERILAVQHLLNTARLSLRSDIMPGITRLSGIPVPNYVLLHDEHYSRVWQLYLVLLHQTALLENAWRNRHQLIQQFIFFRMVLAIRFNFTSIFQTTFWFSSDIKRDGLFIKNSSFRQWISSGNGIMQFCIGCEDVPKSKKCTYGAQIFSADQKFRQYASVIYLPRNQAIEEIKYAGGANHCFFIFSEVPLLQISENKRIMLVQSIADIENATGDWISRCLREKYEN